MDASATTHPKNQPPRPTRNRSLPGLTRSRIAGMMGLGGLCVVCGKSGLGVAPSTIGMPSGLGPPVELWKTSRSPKAQEEGN